MLVRAVDEYRSWKAAGNDGNSAPSDPETLRFLVGGVCSSLSGSESEYSTKPIAANLSPRQIQYMEVLRRLCGFDKAAVRAFVPADCCAKEMNGSRIPVDDAQNARTM